MATSPGCCSSCKDWSRRPAPKILRGFDWHYFERMCQPARLRWPAHEHAVSCLAYTPDGRGLASGGHDGLIHLWDAAGKAVQTCRGHRGRIRGIAFSADGKSLASASHDRTVKLWDVASGKETRTIALDEPVLCVAWAANGRLACGTAQNNLHLFDGEKQQTLPLAEAVRAVTFSADSKFLAASAGRLVHVLNGQDLEKLHALAGPDGDVRVLAFSPDGLTLAGAGYDPTIRLWDVTTGQEKAKLPGHHDPVSGLAFSPDGQTLASGEGDPSHLFLPKEELKSRPGGARARPGEIKLWDLATKLERASLRRHSGPVYCLAYRPDGQELASAGDDMSIVIWDVSGRERTQLPGHTREVNAVAVSPDGKLLASVSDDRDLRLWDIATGQSVDVLRPSGNIKAVAFAPDGATIAIGGGDKLIWLIATESRQSMGTLKGHAGTIRSIVYSSDGRRLVTAAGDPYQKPPRPGEIKLWDTASGELLADLKGHADVVRGVAVSPDGRWAASGSDDRSVKVWDLDARREVTTLTLAEGVRSVAFSPDSAHAGHRRRRRSANQAQRSDPVGREEPGTARGAGGPSRHRAGRGLRPGRPVPGDRQQRRHRPPLGRRHRPGARLAGGPSRLGAGAGVRPGWQGAGDRRQRSHGATLVRQTLSDNSVPSFAVDWAGSGLPQ